MRQRRGGGIDGDPAVAVDLTMAEAAVLCGEVLPQLDCRDAFTVELDEARADFRAAETAPEVEFGSGDGGPIRNDWFDLSVSVNIDGYQVPISAIIAQLASGATHMLLPNGVYFLLATPELAAVAGTDRRGPRARGDRGRQGQRGVAQRQRYGTSFSGWGSSTSRWQPGGRALRGWRPRDRRFRSTSPMASTDAA